MEQWTPLSVDQAVQQAQAMSEIDTVGDAPTEQKYRIFFRRFDSPDEQRYLDTVSSKEDADKLKFWIEAEEVLCLMGCKREVAESIADEFRDAIAFRGERPTLEEVVERGKKVDPLCLHPESPLRQKHHPTQAK
jgi:hypothetical protein